MRATAPWMLQVAMEEPREFVGRGHCRWRQHVHVVWRNGYEPNGVQTEAGLLTLAVP